MGKIKLLVSAILLAFTVIFAGCASSSTSIGIPVKKEYAQKFDSFNVEEEVLGKNAPDDKKMLFEEKIKDVFEKNSFKNGNGLKIKYSFLGYDEGNQFVRYMVGFGAGSGKMTVKTTFTDSNTNIVLGSIETEGTLSMGAFGGDFDGAIEKVANDI